MMKFFILFISFNKLLSISLSYGQFQRPQLNYKIESNNNNNNLEQYKQCQQYDALYQILKAIFKNPSTHIEFTVEGNKPTLNIKYNVEDAVKYHYTPALNNPTTTKYTTSTEPFLLN